MPLPRLLPLVAIAAGGVLAINAVENGPGIIGAARSFAEGVAAKPAAAQAKAASALPADAGLAAQNASQSASPKPAPICAESPTQLAQAAGLSPAELQVIQSLGARRGELDAQQQGLSTELALVQAAEQKVDARIATMNALKGDLQNLLGQLDAKHQAELERLVKVYETMKPAAAAARFVLLSDDVRLPIAAAMKDRSLSAIIANMPPPDAKKLTESLAARYLAQENAAKQAIDPPPAATPAPSAQAGNAGAAAKPAKAPVRRKRRHRALAANAKAPTPAKPAGGAAPVGGKPG